ncbi:MAG: 50S ribosomal protein L25 [Candidatus Velthaea sp.]
MAKHEQIGTLALEHRGGTGTTTANGLRHAGKVPGIVYGHGDPTPVAIDLRTLEAVIIGGAKSSVLSATVGGKPDSVLLRAVQRDPVSHRPIHFDFQRISKGEAVTATVPVVALGTSRAVKDGAVMDIITRAIEVKGPADKIPEHIEIDVTEIDVNHHISASDLKLPAGFTLVTPPETTILTIEASRTAALAEASAPAPVEEAVPDAPAAPAP